jgi:oligoendopeptidase F
VSDTIRARNEIAPEHTWNAPSVFPSVEAWEAELKSISDSLLAVQKFKGRLNDGPDLLADALSAVDDLNRRLGKVVVYAGLAHSVDTTDQAATGRNSQAQGLNARTRAAIAFLDPELLGVGHETLRRWMRDEPRLAIYAHYFDNLFRKQAHVRSAEVEEVLGLVADPFSGPSSTAGMLTNADFTFKPAVSSDGQELPLAQGTYLKLRGSADRETRRTAWENYTEVYLAFKSTLASNLIASIKQNVFNMRARGHTSTLAAALSESNVPVEVFHNLIGVFRKNLPTWHRYWRLRRRALGVQPLQPYDIWGPLTDHKPSVPYPQAVDWIGAGMAPLGEEYVRVLRQGCLVDRWVDIYPNVGKTAGAFSSGTQGTHPFIVMSYNDSIISLSTLAHELGHSLHSYFTWQTQPMVYSDYSLFVAEVASNFNQALVRAHLLKTNTDPAFQISLLEEAMANFHRYFFIMPTLARFELETHERIERGQGLTADDMNELMADLFSEGYGGEVQIDRAREGITWATFGHLYADYYVYQYATGIAGAHALSKRILSGVPGAAEAYLGFLKAGGSVYGLDALKQAGVDLATPQPVEETFDVLAGMVERLESLLDK